MEIDARLVAIREIEEGLFDEEDGMLLGEARKELLRALPDEAPAQVAEDDDAVSVGGFCLARGRGDVAGNSRLRGQTRRGVGDAAARLGGGAVAAVGLGC